MPTTAAYAILGDPDRPEQVLWVGTEGKGLFRYDVGATAEMARLAALIGRPKPANSGAGFWRAIRVWMDGVGNHRKVRIRDALTSRQLLHRTLHIDVCQPAMRCLISTGPVLCP